MTISAELSGALRYCGDDDGERVPLPKVYSFWLDGCLLMDADLEFSESFRQLIVNAIDITEKQQLLPSIGPFDFEIGLDYRAAGTNDRWRRIQIVAPERVSPAESIGTWFAAGWWFGQSNSRVASFYGSPRSVILSFDPAPYEFRLWSVPAAPRDRTNPDEVSGLPETYRPLREVLAANAMLPHCGHDEITFERLQKVIDKMLLIWQPRWERFRNRPLKREGSRRPGFKRGTGNRHRMMRY